VCACVSLSCMCGVRDCYRYAYICIWTPHCNALQYTATRCNTLQQFFTYTYMYIPLCNTLQHATTQCTATRCNTLQHVLHMYIYVHTTLHHTATRYNTLQHVLQIYMYSCADVCVREQRAATHCNTLQHAATHCNMFFLYTCTHVQTFV